MNVATKSGSNQFRGTVFGYWQPEGLESDYTRTVLPNATRSAEAVNTVNAMTGDAGFEIGGPIWRIAPSSSALSIRNGGRPR